MPLYPVASASIPEILYGTPTCEQLAVSRIHDPRGPKRNVPLPLFVVSTWIMYRDDVIGAETGVRGVL